MAVPFDRQDELQHLLVLTEAYKLFRERSEMRGDMWRSFPPSDKVRELRERVSRIETLSNLIRMTKSGASEARIAVLRAEALDIINYAAFLVKQLDEGNFEL